MEKYMSKQDLLKVLYKVEKSYYATNEVSEIKHGIINDELKDLNDLDEKLNVLREKLGKIPVYKNDDVENIVSSIRNLIKNEKDKDTQIKSPSDSESNLSSGEGGTGNGSEDDIEESLSKYVNDVRDIIFQESRENNIWEDQSEPLVGEFQDLRNKLVEYNKNNNNENKIKLEEAIGNFYKNWNKVIDDLPKPNFLKSGKFLERQESQESAVKAVESNSEEVDDLKSILEDYSEKLRGLVNGKIAEIGEGNHYKDEDFYKQMYKSKISNDISQLNSYISNYENKNKEDIKKFIKAIYDKWNSIIDNLPKPSFLKAEESLGGVDESLGNDARDSLEQKIWADYDKLVQEKSGRDSKVPLEEFFNKDKIIKELCDKYGYDEEDVEKCIDKHIDGDLRELGEKLLSNQEQSASDVELLSFIEKTMSVLENEVKIENNNLSLADKAKMRTLSFLLKLSKESLKSTNKIDPYHAKFLLEFLNDKQELAKKIEPDEDMINKIKNKLASCTNIEEKEKNEEKGEHTDSKAMNSVSNEQIQDLIGKLMVDLFKIKNICDGEKKTKAVTYIACLGLLEKKLENKLGNNESVINLTDVANLKNAFEFVAENVGAGKDLEESNSINAENEKIIDKFAQKIKNDELLMNLIDAAISDLKQFIDNEEAKANESDDCKYAKEIINNLKNYKKGILNNNESLKTENSEAIANATNLISKHKNKYIKDPKIYGDEFKNIEKIEEFDTVLKDDVSDLKKFLTRVTEEIDNEIGKMKKTQFFKKRNLSDVSADLKNLLDKIETENNITDKDVKNFKGILDDDNLKDILELQDEDKEKYIKTLESLRDKEKSNEIDEQQNDDEQQDNREAGAQELDVKEIKKDKKTYLKHLAGVAGFALGTALGYAVPYPAGLVVTYGIAAVRATTRIASHFLAGKENKITSIVKNVEKKFPKITRFAKSVYVERAIYGFAAGYTIGKLSKLIVGNLISGETKQSSDYKTAADKSTENTTEAAAKPTENTTETVENSKTIEKLSDNEYYNITSMSDKGFDSSTMDHKVSLNKDFLKNAFLDKDDNSRRKIDGQTMVRLKDKETGEYLSWFKEQDIVDMLNDESKSSSRSSR